MRACTHTWPRSLAAAAAKSSVSGSGTGDAAPAKQARTSDVGSDATAPGRALMLLSSRREALIGESA